ncbi:glycosyltransferase [Desulfoglaeba alkanexedens]|uniref:Glycosyltransferase family 4 protein n=1 Tax=Desulfoglaeba alkanexedens ALDC TaxID=980445 RepID=A0A4P8L0E1_9BACT|nr:glycosyltransferase [Desulfoglaeba alkanexedens]QCQ21180.1 glycosyltransferase family 4 protein [Desulfoglaeba alkanexedens ALDC]
MSKTPQGRNIVTRSKEKSDHPYRLTYISRARLHRARANVIQTVKTVEGLARIGVSVDLHVPPWKGNRNLPNTLNALGVQRTFSIQAHNGLRSFWRALAFAPFFWRFGKPLREAPAVYTRSADLSMALIRHRIPHNFEVHDMDTLRRQGVLDVLVDAYGKGLIRQFFPISRAAAVGLLEKGLDPHRVHVAPCGADLSLYADMAPWDPSRLRHPHIMYVGRISRDRGLDVLERLARLDFCRVTVVGVLDDAPSTNHIRVVSFVPHREIPRYLEQADILVMPYQRNLRHAASISPMKLFEAMAAGRPIVVSDLEPIREIVQDGKTALCVKPDDGEAWEAAIRSLRDDPEAAQRMACQAQKEAARYSWENRARILRDTIFGKEPEHLHG